MQAGNAGGHHALLRQLAGIDTADGDLCLTVAFRAAWRHAPGIERIAEPAQLLVLHVGQLGFRIEAIGGQPAGRQACGQQLCEHVAEVFFDAALAVDQLGTEVGLRQEVEHQRCARLPETGNLQHRRAGQTAMREQQVFEKRRAGFFGAGADIDFQRNPGQLDKWLPGLWIKGQRHQRRTRRDHLEPELRGDAIRKISRAYLGDRQSAGSDHDAGSFDHAGTGIDDKTALALADAMDLARHAPTDLTDITFGLKHRNDVFGRVIAEQLALVLFVITNPVALDQAQKILRRIARQRAFAKMRVLRQEIGRAGLQVGEVAAAAAGDTDFFGQLFGVIDQHDLASALASHGCGHHAGRACTNYCHVNMLCHQLARIRKNRDCKPAAR
ncbi:hypothetical protein IMCC9480_1706 [Oxalobacteraceae bacterium IMCC9480]|nr:hypothetical protein IMCC9480_1706 [Oxalobacteraceae bacterium IMCC9480]